MDQCRSRLKLSENFERHWSIRISGEIHMDQSLVHTFSWGNSYGPMVLKVLLKFPPTLVLVHGWLFPAGKTEQRYLNLAENVPDEGGSKTHPFGRGVLREVLLLPLFPPTPTLASFDLRIFGREVQTSRFTDAPLRKIYGAEFYTPPPPTLKIPFWGAYKIPAAWGPRIYTPTPLPWKMPFGKKWGGGGGFLISPWKERFPKDSRTFVRLAIYTL